MAGSERLPADTPHQAALRQAHEDEVREGFDGISERDIKAIADLRMRRGTPTAADVALASELENTVSLEEPLAEVVRPTPQAGGQHEFPTRFGPHTTVLGDDERLSGDIMG